MAVGTTIIGATVSSTFSFILNLLLPSLREELVLLAGFQDDLEKLQNLFKRIESVLKDAMTQQLKGNSFQDWLEKLTDVAHHAEDVLDEFNFEVLRRKTANRKGHLRKVCDFFSHNNQLKFRFLMAHKIKDLQGKINSFAEEVSKFNLGQAAPQRPLRDMDENKTHSYCIPTDFIGRDEEKERVVAMLLGAGATSGNISVVAIVGVGGVGKTTLAQMVYNDSRVDGHFHLQIWICVSDNFVFSGILKTIITSAKESCEVDELDQLQMKVRDVLRRKRFLLVLDDVWNEEPQKWLKLEKILSRSGLLGSKIMVTTRSQKVSLIMQSQNLLLGPLPDDFCWKLFKRRAFEVGQTPSKNLEEIGKEIAKKCGGNPLAAEALGSYLLLKPDEVDWRLVEESEMWQLFNSETGEIKPVLQLSYDHLKPQEKQCFAFSSLFPKDYEMEKGTLIRQWTSHGFVQNEQDGREVFNNLLWRSFFLEAKKDEDGKVIKCKLHDLMHDLARSVAGKHFCMATKDINRDVFNERTYHLLINRWSSSSAMLEETKKAKSLRTLLVSRCNPMERSLLGKIFVTLRCMRVLDLSSSGIKVVPDSVCYLMHLRYLDMSSNPIELLPQSIGCLLNLEVLELAKTKLRKLPKSFGKLQNLRHLDIRGCSYLTDMPVGLERLTHLQTLSDFIVGKSKTSSTLKELIELDLSGELFIWHLENFKTEATETEQTILYNKNNLVSLRLTWDHRNISASNIDNERTLNLLRPHKNLKQLQLHNYTGPKFPLWLSDSLLESLVKVKLTYCTNCEYLPAFGSIPSLKDLQIIGMHEVKKISVEFYGTGPVKGFPSLEKLAFFDMPKLEQWSVLEGTPFSKLIALTIGRCGVLSSIPLVQSLKILDLSHCSSLLLNSLPNNSNLSALSSLVIDNIQGLTSFPDGLLLHLSSLRKLIVSSCKQLEHLPLQYMERLVALRFLEISDCPQLNTLSFNATQLTCLQSLNIRNCTNLTSLPRNWTGISSLQSINISNCRNVTSWTELEIMGLNSITDFSLDICNDKVDLSGWLQHLTNLQTLTIHGGHTNLLPQPGKLIMGNYLMICCCGDRLVSLLHGLSNASSLEDLGLKCISDTVLPDSIGEIQSLQHLLIRDCEGFESLPNSLKELTRLEGLWIQGCPNLEKRCKRDIGEDWSIIEHVRSVQIVEGNITNKKPEKCQRRAEKMEMVILDASRDQKSGAIQERKIQTGPKEDSLLESKQQVGSEVLECSTATVPANATGQEQLLGVRKDPEQGSGSSHSKALEKYFHSIPTNRRPGKEPMLEHPKSKETVEPRPKLMAAAIQATRPTSIQNNGGS